MKPELLRGVLVAVGAIGAFGAATAPGAKAHSFYEYRCCSDRDCTPIAFDEVQVTPQGYMIISNGTVLPFDDERIRPTPPEDALQHYHLCTTAGKKTGSVICLYVPQGGV
jgi:hypothetical protein